jgi:uncharacterized membrane protein HdeD (DUF308 family)
LFIAGISSLLFGTLTLAFPAFPFLSLIGLFASYIIIKGFAISIGAWQTRQEEEHWLYLLFYGALNILTGIIALVYPILTLLILGFIVSVNLFLCGVLQIMIAYHLRKGLRNRLAHFSRLSP